MPPRLLPLLIACLVWSALPAERTSDQLTLTSPSTPPAGAELRLAQALGRKGPTSIRYYGPDVTRSTQTTPNPNDPNGATFYTRDRDLGQTFTVPPGKAFRLGAVTLRVGPVAASGSLTDALGAPVYIQIFEVDGTPVIHDYGTTGPVQVSSGYTNPATMAMADDYITGETYTSRLVATGAHLPASLTLGQGNTGAPTSSSTGSLLRFDLSATGAPILHPGRRYAFMVGFMNYSASMSIPLDNWDYLNQTAPTPTSEQLQSGPYAGGHAIRREGRIPNPHENLDLVFSPDPLHSVFDPATRFAQQPTTFGRPDVDTYRDLTFWIEGTDVSDYVAWADLQGVEDSALFDDANGDGIPNAVPYLLGGDLAATPQPWIQLGAGPAGLSFRQTRNQLATGVLGEFEWSPDLALWYPNRASAAGLKVDIDATLPTQPGDLPPDTSLYQYTVVPTPAAPARLFVRLKVREDLPTLVQEPWSAGATRTVSAGSQRLLLLVAAQESTAAGLSVASASYGGQPMTLIGQQTATDVNGSDCVAVFYLPEPALAAAVGDAFAVVWNGAGGKGPSYASTLIHGVDPVQPIAAMQQVAAPAYLAGSTLSTAALLTRRHDLALLATVHGSAGTLTPQNGFASALAFVPSGCVALVARRSSLAESETPGASHPSNGRMALVGWTVAAAP